MLISLLTSRLAIRPDWATIILVFFAYSFLGNIMECAVVSLEKKRFIYNRGFVAHLPFCIIYGFGAMIGFAVLSPLQDTWVELFLVGAFGASMFELVVANLQLRLFGEFWWDYENKPFNYKGILCLESTIGWGCAALFVVKFAHGALVSLINLVPNGVAIPIAISLLALYVLDFFISAYTARNRKTDENLQKEMQQYKTEQHNGVSISNDIQ